MGGRGASSGVSISGKKYGSEYTTVYQSGNIKFIKQNGNSSINTPMETMTNGRVYATIGKSNEIKSITYFNKNVKRKKQIDLTHYHKINGKRTSPHTHKGYVHDEKGTYNLSDKEIKMVDRVMKAWDYFNRRK